MNAETDSGRSLLRHTLATLAYRGGKAVRDASPDFQTFRVAESGRTPVEILAHIGDLMDWGLSIARGKQTWNNAKPLLVGPVEKLPSRLACVQLTPG